MPTQVYSFTKVTNEVYRPILPVKIINPQTKKFIPVFALADTGADDCLFPMFVADQLGYDLKGAGTFSSNQGIGENRVNLWKHPFVICLLDPTRQNVVWKSKECDIGVTDHNNNPPLLGYCSFLCNFKIVFNYPTKKIIVEWANGK